MALIKEILGDVYRPSIKEYLSTYSTIEETTIALNKSYNQLVIEKSLLTPARRSIYNQAEYYLTEGLADAYIQPAKYLLMQQVSTGVTIKDAERVLRNWNDGELTSGKLASGRQTPNLQKYARQISVDSIHQYNGTIQQVIKDEFQLTKGVYVGDIIKDSRPFCKHMVGMKRKIEIDEIPDLIKRFPDGIIPGTTKKNFSVYRGGYGCRHLWMWVK